jgi:hypothetical protein
MRVIADSWVMAAMIRRAPRRHNGQVAISRIKDVAQQSSPVPIRSARLQCIAVDTLLARCRNDRRPELAVRR